MDSTEFFLFIYVYEICRCNCSGLQAVACQTITTVPMRVQMSSVGSVDYTTSSP